MFVESLSPYLFAWIAFAIALAGLIHGALGFGFPFVATPLIAIVSDMRTAVFTVLVPTLAAVAVNIAMSGSLRPVLARFWMMPLYAIVGSFAGTTLFVLAPDVPYALLLALAIFVYLNLDRLGLSELPAVRRHERVFAPFSGIAAGFFEGTANVAAPPLIVFYLALGLAPAMVVQGLNICFLVGKIIQFTVLTARGGITFAQWAATLPLAAVAVGALIIGLRIRNRIDAQTFRVWVKRFLLATALVLLGRYAYSVFA
jgi:uncharacterized protein